MLRPLYDWTLRLAAHRNAAWALGGVSFVESSFFPIPPDTLLIPMVLAKRAKAWAYATICTVTSVLGGVAGYLIGYFLFDVIGEPLLAFYGYGGKFQDFAARYNEWGAWIVFIAGVTPFPYKVITIASGVTHLNIFVFILASIAARAARFYAVAGLLYLYGPAVRNLIERRLGLIATLAVALLLGGFLLIRLIA
jgi:membrane protein YqaA with SNARE-associated domain